MTGEELLPRLIMAGIEPTPARLFAYDLAWVFERPATSPAWRMTALRWAHVVGQLRHESNGFTRLEENLRYSPERLLKVFGERRVGGRLDEAARLCAAGPKAIANRVYANMLGNGDEASGDGWAHRGGGLIQTTGKANYAGLLRDLAINPDHVRTVRGAVLAARYFFDANNLWPIVDANDVDGLTERINGKRKLGLEERRNFTREAFEAFT